MSSSRHRHHIVPRHLGGTDDESNIAILTVQEHAEAHMLRWLVYRDKMDWYAWKGLEGTIGKEELHRLATNEGFSRFQQSDKYKDWCKQISDRMKGNQNGKGLKGYKRTPEECKKISDRMKSSTGENSTRAKKVITPEGEFISAVEAAKHYNIAHSTAKNRARLGQKGWKYA